VNPFVINITALAYVVQRDSLQQLCLMNILVHTHKCANDSKTAARNIYFIAAFILFYMCRRIWLLFQLCKIVDIHRVSEKNIHSYHWL